MISGKSLIPMCIMLLAMSAMLYAIIHEAKKADCISQPDPVHKLFEAASWRG